MTSFPDQTIPESKKTIEWGSLHADYGYDLLRYHDRRRVELDELYQSFNGVKTPASIKYLTATYGKKNRSKFIPYRAHKTKIQLMIGEFLSRPLAATVETINRDAKSAKMAQMDYWYGAMVAKPELEHLKNKVGVDVTEGAPIPDSEEDPLWDKLSPKDKEESIMQVILNEQIPELDLKKKFSEGVLNCAIGSVIYSKIERNEEGETDFINIDPRNAIYEEIEGDNFLEKSPIMGARQWMTVHDVLRRYKLSDTQEKMLKDIAANPGNYTKSFGSSIKYNSAGGLVVEVMHLEWKSVKPIRFKKMKKTASQIARDNEDQYITQDLSNEVYDKSKDYFDKEIEKGNMQIETRWRETMYEITRIGGMKEMDVNFREAYFLMRRVDDPTRIIGGSYTGYLCNTVDGKRISLFQEMENWSNIFDVTMYKILKDINRANGKVLGYNLATLGKDDTVNDVMYNAINDGFVTYDTSATGNQHARDVSLGNILQEFDMGLSQSFPSLIAFKNDILAMMDRMTGINENREGQISASATATNTNSAIQASRTITEPFFYGIYLYISKTLMKIVESTKVTWAFYKLEKGEQILGTSKWNYLKVTQELGFKDYGVHLQDGGKYQEVRQFMQSMMEASLNAKEMRPEDALKFMLSETFADQKAVLEGSWAKIKEFEQQNNEAQMQNQQAMQQAQLQQQIELAREDREDRQAHDLQKIVVTADEQIRIDDNKGTNKIIEQTNKSTLDSENSQF